MKKNRLFCCLSVRDFEPNILIKGVHLTCFEKKPTFDRKLIFSYEERHTYCLSKKAKDKYMSPYYLLFCIQYEFIQKARHTTWLA